MVEEFLRFPFFHELPAFTAFELRHSEPVRHCQGGSLAEGLYDTSAKGIKFSVFRGENSDQYREASYTWGGFVRRCKAAGLAPEQLHQDKEDAPCNTETPAQTGAAAATTDASAAPEPSKTAETTTTPASGAGASTSMSQESGISGRSSLPAPASHADKDAAAADPSCAEPAPSTTTTFDFCALDADTAEKLRGITDCVMELYQSYAWGMAYQVGRAHDLLCGNGGSCETVSRLHKATATAVKTPSPPGAPTSAWSAAVPTTC